MDSWTLVSAIGALLLGTTWGVAELVFARKRVASALQRPWRRLTGP